MEKDYVFVQNGKINGYGMCPCTGENLYSVEVSKETYDNIAEFGNNYYIFKDGKIILNPDYEALQAESENRARIENIKAELEAIDISSQRSSRAISLCILNEETPNPEDVKKLMDYENKAAVLREELQELESLGNNESEGINE